MISFIMTFLLCISSALHAMEEEKEIKYPSLVSECDATKRLICASDHIFNNLYQPHWKCDSAVCEKMINDVTITAALETLAGAETENENLEFLIHTIIQKTSEHTKSGCHEHPNNLTNLLESTWNTFEDNLTNLVKPFLRSTFIEEDYFKNISEIFAEECIYLNGGYYDPGLGYTVYNQPTTMDSSNKAKYPIKDAQLTIALLQTSKPTWKKLVEKKETIKKIVEDNLTEKQTLPNFDKKFYGSIFGLWSLVGFFYLQRLSRVTSGKITLEIPFMLTAMALAIAYIAPKADAAYWKEKSVIAKREASLNALERILV